MGDGHDAVPTLPIIHFQDIPALFEGHDGDASVGFEHLAEIGNLHVKGEGIGVAVVTPNGLENGVTLYSLTDGLCKDGKDFRLAGGEVMNRSINLYS